MRWRKSRCILLAQFNTRHDQKGESPVTTIVTKITVKTTKGWRMLYWTSTIFIAFAFAASGAADLLRVPDVAKGIARLGYPAYFPMILGMWKLLGSTAIIIPGLPRLKEWAYAGMFFTLTGAALSHAVVGDPVGKILVPLALLAAAMTSWTLQPARGVCDRRIAGTQRAGASIVVLDIEGHNR
jgi:hypothetical protein